MKQCSKYLRTIFFGSVAFLFLMSSGSREALAEDRALFQLGGLDYLESELPPKLRLALYEVEDEYYLRLQLIFDEVLLDSYLGEESKRLGKSKDEVKAERLSAAEPDEDSIRAFYATIKDRIGKPYKDVRGRIAEILQQREIEKKKAILLADYREKNDFKILLPRITPPTIKIHSEGFPTKGDPKAVLTIVEFADYQCPHCATAANAIKQIYQDFKGKIRVIYMDYPINRSGISRLIARGAACADEQEKFWSYHELAYQRQATLSKDSPMGLAKDAELDLKKFIDCFQSEEAEAKVARSEGEAKRLGLNSTPTIFVNGKRVTIFNDIEKDLRQAVEGELAYFPDANP